MAVPCCRRNVEITKVRNLTKEQFTEQYLKSRVPVIIQDATTEWPAIKNWTLDYLCEKCGENKVNVRSNTNSEDYRAGRKYGIRQTTLGEYISDLKKGNKRAQSSYMAVQNMKLTFPEITDDAPLPDYVGKLHMGPYLWIALKGHYEYCHFDPDDNMLIPIQGRKQVRLFGCDIDPMYPNQRGSKGRTIQSPIECDDPDLQLYPDFQNNTCHYGIVEPGEILYFPAFWWHQVTSLDNCISINIFFGDAGKNNFLTKIMEPPQWPAFSYWLLNIIEQNVELSSFNRTLSRLPEVLVSFLLKQWHEVPHEEQLNRLVQLVLDYCKLDKLPEPEGNQAKNPRTLQIRGLTSR